MISVLLQSNNDMMFDKNSVTLSHEVRGSKSNLVVD